MFERVLITGSQLKMARLNERTTFYIPFSCGFLCITSLTYDNTMLISTTVTQMSPDECGDLC